MDNPTKILIGGAICAAIIAGMGALNTARLKANLKRLETQCIEEEGKQERQHTGIDFKTVCDGADLSDLALQIELNKTGLQAQIAAAYDDAGNSSAMPNLLAIGILIIFAIPWTWYFLLRRIRELREAIVGK
jgi:hypothetical protein